MRFECDSCHAKYKISDEKVAGRLVRFPCRKCDNKILIDGRLDDVTVPAGPAYGYEEVTRRSVPSPLAHEAATARQRGPDSLVRRRHSSVPPRRPPSVARRVSSLPPAASSALVGQRPGLAPPLPSKSKVGGGPLGAAKVDKAEWHVSINDVPIGPITLEEMAHKVDAGAVSEYSLVWSDGFDEWRPLATVPQLMFLLYERRSSGPPARSQFSSMPPFVEAQTAIKETSEPPPVLAPSKPPAPPKPPIHALSDLSDVSVEFLPLGEMAQPPAPLGPEPTFQSDPPAGAFSGLPQPPDEPVSVPAVPPQPVVTEPRTGSALWVWGLMVAVAVFSGVVAVLAFDKYGDTILEKLLGSPSAPVQQAPKAVPPVDTAARVGRAAPVKKVAVAEEAELVDEAEATDVEEAETLEEAAAVEGEEVAVEEDTVEEAATDSALAIEPPKPAEDGPTIQPAKPRRRTQAKQPAKPGDDALSAEEQELLAAFGSSDNAEVAKIDVKESGSTKSKRDPLNSKAVNTTVSANKPRLQRCYERAIRGQRSPTAVRMNVSLTVTASGRVSSVDVIGSGPGGLRECMEASIRRWRFPASSGGGSAKFPIVFSAN